MDFVYINFLWLFHLIFCISGIGRKIQQSLVLWIYQYVYFSLFVPFTYLSNINKPVFRTVKQSGINTYIFTLQLPKNDRFSSLFLANSFVYRGFVFVMKASLYRIFIVLTIWLAKDHCNIYENKAKTFNKGNI